MSRGLLDRIKTAGAYQKKAFRALFPEKMNAHIDVIEREVKCMVLETAADLLKGCGKGNGDFDAAKKPKAKKVEIA